MTGIVLLDKPNDMTSFGAIARIRRILGVKKAGHTGTLDPMATGVLPVMLGGATRFIDFLPTHDKAYKATVVLGIETDTLDTSGTVIKTSDKSVSREELEAVLCDFRGSLMQYPPMYSAKFKDGVRLYELARKGIEVEREANEVTVYSLELLSFDEENRSFEIDVSCSAGTYIRSLADDIGRALGCGAAISALRRTSANGFGIEECHTLEEIEALVKEDRADEIITPVDRVLDCYEAVTVTQPQAVRFRNGGELDAGRVKGMKSEGLFRVYSPDGVFLGIGENRDANLWPKKVFSD